MNRNTRGTKGQRLGRFRSRGAVLLEFAIVAPLLFTMVFGIIEFGYRMMVRQTMVQAAQVAARTASLPGITDTNILAAVDRYLAAAGYNGGSSDYDVQIVHATAGDPSETVTISMSAQKASLTGLFHVSGTMTVSAVLPKEGQL
jgi:Flp pilus assembly protein TadG